MSNDHLSLLELLNTFSKVFLDKSRLITTINHSLFLSLFVREFLINRDLSAIFSKNLINHDLSMLFR